MGLEIASKSAVVVVESRTPGRHGAWALIPPSIKAYLRATSSVNKAVVCQFEIRVVGSGAV